MHPDRPAPLCAGAAGAAPTSLASRCESTAPPILYVLTRAPEERLVPASTQAQAAASASSVHAYAPSAPAGELWVSSSKRAAAYEHAATPTWNARLAIWRAQEHAQVHRTVDHCRMTHVAHCQVLCALAHQADGIAAVLRDAALHGAANDVSGLASHDLRWHQSRTPPSNRHFLNVISATHPSCHAGELSRQVRASCMPN